jgi:predicted oxidoreductase
VDQPFVVNQLELSLLHLHLIDAGVVMNQDDPPWPVRNEDTMEYCRLHDITIQAWSPLARGRVTGAKVDKPDKRIQETAKLVAAMAEEKQVSREAIVVAWLLRHPAKIQPIIGTKNPGRIQAASAGDTVELSREEWYKLFAAGRGSRVP